MDFYDMFADLLLGILIDVSAEQINELIKVLLGNPELVASGHGMDLLGQAFVDHDIDASQLSDRDWYRLGEAFVAARVPLSA